MEHLTQFCYYKHKLVTVMKFQLLNLNTLISWEAERCFVTSFEELKKQIK